MSSVGSRNKREQNSFPALKHPFVGRAAGCFSSPMEKECFCAAGVPDAGGSPGLPEYSPSTFGKHRRSFIVLQQEGMFMEASFLAADRKFIPILQSSSQVFPEASFLFPPSHLGWTVLKNKSRPTLLCRQMSFPPNLPG